MGHLDRGVLLVADVMEEGQVLDENRRDLEMPETRIINELIGGIERCGMSVTHVTEPRDIPAHALKYNECAVLSLWSGTHSRNRRCIVPGICEGYGLPYIGADAHTAAVCSDKALAKSICHEFGLSTAPFIVVRNNNQLRLLELMNYPLVLKPLHEGGSIGISQSNKVLDAASAQLKAAELLRNFKQPILCEEFLPGREISFALVGRDLPTHIEAVEILIDGEPNYFNSHLFSVDEKRNEILRGRRQYRNITQEIDSGTIETLRRIYQNLGKVDYMRVDGKWHQGQFHCIELSADPGIGEKSWFAQSFYTIDRSYEDMMREILSTRLENVGGANS